MREKRVECVLIMLMVARVWQVVWRWESEWIDPPPEGCAVRLDGLGGVVAEFFG